MGSVTFDALMLLSFGGPEGPDDVLPFLENVTRGRGVPPERLAEVADHYHHFGKTADRPTLGNEAKGVATAQLLGTYYTGGEKASNGTETLFVLRCTGSPARQLP